MADDLVEITEEQTMSREDAAARLRDLADRVRDQLVTLAIRRE